jgi:hypothetical protein
MYVHYCVHNIPILVPVLHNTKAVHAHPHQFFHIQFNIIFQLKTMSSKWPLYFRFPHQNPVYFYLISLYVPLATLFILFPYTCHLPHFYLISLYVPLATPFILFPSTCHLPHFLLISLYVPLATLLSYFPLRPTCHTFILFPFTYHLPHTAQPSRFDHPSNIQRRVQMIKLSIKQFSPVLYYLRLVTQFKR